MKIPSLKIGKLNIDSKTLSKIILSLFIIGFFIGISVALTKSGYNGSIPLIFMIIAPIPLWFGLNRKKEGEKY